MIAGSLIAGGGASAHAATPVSCAIDVDTRAFTCDRSTATSWAVEKVALASLYTGPNFTGEALTYYRAEGGCDTDRSTIEVVDPSFDDARWNNEIESVETFSNCRIKLFRWTNYGGGSTAWLNTWADLSTGDNWANNVSSVKIS